MSMKSVSNRVEKELSNTVKGFENLFQAMTEYVESAMDRLVDTFEKCGNLVESKTIKLAKKSTQTNPKKTSKKAIKPSKKTAAPKKARSVGGLKKSLLDILQNESNPLTEESIAKKLMENPEKYKWNKNESTLYQTLRRAVKEQLISESEDRSKESKTYKASKVA